MHYLEVSGIFCFWSSIFLGTFLNYYRLSVAPKAASLSPTLGVLFPTLAAYIERLWPLFMLLVFYMGYWAVCLLIFQKLPIFRNSGLVIGIGAGVFSLLALIFQWIVFIFRLHIFEQIPGWYWPIMVKPNLIKNSAFFITLLVFILLTLFLVHKFPRKYFIGLILTSLAFIGTQLSVGYMEGRGLASLTDRFFLSYHRVYTEEACNSSVSAYNAIVNYEDNYPSMFFQTKPPGVLWLSFQIKNLANLRFLSPVLDRFSNDLTLSEFLPGMSSLSCKRTMALVTLLFPLVASTSIWVIYGFSKRIIGGSDFALIASYSAILFLLAPNIVLLALFPDQALYSPLFLLVAGVIFWSMKNKSFAGCFLAGIALYCANFLSFSMLPLFIVPLIYFACTLWQEEKLSEFWARNKSTLFPIGLGALFTLIVFKVFVNYDIFTRFQRMMTTRIEGDFYTRLGISLTREATFFEKIQQTWNAAILNNIELAVAINIPVFVLFVVMGLRSVSNVFNRKPDPNSPINATLFITYLALNAIRAVLGEAGRLWMFWVPVMALLTVQYLLPFFRRNRWAMPVFACGLIFSLFLTYQFQDYLMPQLLP